jgi:hypothetical protein
MKYIDPVLAAQLEAAGKNSLIAGVGTVAVNLLISLVFGGPISAMWVMVNALQLISLLPLMGVPYPEIVIMIYSKMLVAHGESTFIPNIYFDSFINKTTDLGYGKIKGYSPEDPLNQKFVDYGWAVSNFYYLSGRKVLLWTAMLGSYPLIKYMKTKYADKHKYCKIWVQVELKYRYTLLLRGVIMSYASMILAIMLNVYNMKMTSM